MNLEHLISADETVRNELQETELIVRMAEGGDLIAIDAKYHLQCLTELRNRYRSLERECDQESKSLSEEKETKVRVFAELCSYIENCVEDGVHYFKFSDLYQLYEKWLNCNFMKEVNRGQLKEKLLIQFQQAQEQSVGYGVWARDTADVEAGNDYENEAVILAKAAKIVRKKIIGHKIFHFDSKFPIGCQQTSVPSSLKLLISLLLNGTSLKDQNVTDSQASLTNDFIQFSFVCSPWC